MTRVVEPDQDAWNLESSDMWKALFQEPPPRYALPLDSVGYIDSPRLGVMLGIAVRALSMIARRVGPALSEDQEARPESPEQALFAVGVLAAYTTVILKDAELWKDESIA